MTLRTVWLSKRSGKGAKVASIAADASVGAVLQLATQSDSEQVDGPPGPPVDGDPSGAGSLSPEQPVNGPPPSTTSSTATLIHRVRACAAFTKVPPLSACLRGVGEGLRCVVELVEGPMLGQHRPARARLPRAPVCPLRDVPSCRSAAVGQSGEVVLTIHFSLDQIVEVA